MPSRNRSLAIRAPAAAVVGLLLLAQDGGHSYQAKSGAWDAIPVHMYIGGVGSPWTSAAAGAVQDWNDEAGREVFSWTRTSAGYSCGPRDERNTVTWQPSVCERGRWVPFDENTLAVEMAWTIDEHPVESDIVFNTEWDWDIYDGDERPEAYDFRRVALHEFGHTLGLDHPDDYGQNRRAIMNSISGDIDRLQRDDVSGVRHLYDDVVVGLPDLVVGSPTIDDTAPDPGESLRFSVSVRNRGGGTAGETILRYQRQSAGGSSWSEIGHDRIGRLSASRTSSEWISTRAPRQSGTHHYRACVDEVLWERDTTNNCSATVSVTVASEDPDLVVQSPLVSPGSVDPEEAFTFSATVRNVGRGAAASTTLRYQRRPRGGFSWSVVGTDGVGQLSPSRQSTQSIRLDAPSRPGTYDYRACVDAVRGESDDTNNCSSLVGLTVRSNEPDLVVQFPRVSPGSVDPEETFTFSATVRNVGRGAAAATTLRYQRQPRGGSSWTEVGSDQVGRLSQRGTSVKSIVLEAPARPGTWDYRACVDVVSGESERANNCSDAVSLTVRSNDPDLVVQSPRVSASAVDPEEAFTFSATVRNAGGAAAAATTLRYQRRSRGGFSWTPVGTDAVAGLPPSGTSFQSIVLTAPAQPGAYDYRACVDEVSGESDRGNNCSDPVGVTVSSSEADLVVQSPAVSPGSVGPGEEFTFSVTVRNAGSVAAAATTLRYQHRSGGVSWTEVGTAGIAGLPPAGTSFRSIVLEAAQAGTHDYRACVDPVSGESEQGNNCSDAVSVVVSSDGGPDLVVRWGALGNVEPAPGESVRYSVSVDNRGEGASAGTTLTYSNRPAGGAWTVAGTSAVGPLAVSGESGDSIAWTAPAQEGPYEHRACVAPGAGESERANNCSRALSVSVSSEARGCVRDMGPVTGALYRLGDWYGECRSVAHSGQARYYNFTLHEASSVEVALSSVHFDQLVALWSGSGTGGELLGVERRGIFDGPLFPTTLSRSLEAGTYTIEATTSFAILPFSLYLTVTPEVANRPPQAVGRLAPVTIGEGAAAVPVEVSGAFVDPDDDRLTYGASSSAPAVAAAVAAGSVVTVTPVALGSATVTVTATDVDGSNSTAMQTFAVTVTPAANRPPQRLGTLPPLEIRVGDPAVPVEVSGTFVDPDDDRLTYGASSSAPAVAAAVAAGSVVTVTPVASGSASVTVTATDVDGSNSTATQTFAVTVSAPADRAALEAFYDATGGTGWTNSTNWKTSAPLGAWHGVTTDAAGRVMGLNLSENGLTGPIPRALEGLANLEELYLYDNALTGPVPAWLGNLARLRWLNLGDNALTGSIPGALAGLTNLEALYLYDNALTGSVPVWLGNLVRLRWLSLSRNDLTGPIPSALGSLANLEDLYLYDNALTGPIPGALASLTNLEVLYLYRNTLTGPLPAWLGNLARLRRLNLGGNPLTGPIPGALSSLVGLEQLSLWGNGLTGPVPAWLGNLDQLRGLSLSRNDLSGPIPDALGNLVNLEELYLYDNALTGPIPGALGNLARLEQLDLHDNALTGPVPDALGSLASLERLYLNSNPLAGPLPLALSRLSRLTHLNIEQTGLCAPFDASFQAWLATIEFQGVTCDPNGPPEPVGALPRLKLELDGPPATVEVSGAFRDPDDDPLTYGATSSAPSVARVSVSGSTVTVTPVAAGSATVTVTATDVDGSNSTATQAFAVAVLRPFTDHPLVPGVTPVKAVHFTELRARIDALRVSAGLGRFLWTDPFLQAGVTRVKLVHLVDLRRALEAAYTAVGRPAPVFSDAFPGPGTPIRAAHLTELRAAVLALE